MSTQAVRLLTPSFSTVHSGSYHSCLLSSLLHFILAGGGHCLNPVSSSLLPESNETCRKSLLMWQSFGQDTFTCELFSPWDGFLNLSSPWPLSPTPRGHTILPLRRSQPSLPFLFCLRQIWDWHFSRGKAAAGVDQFLSNEDPVFMKTSSALKQKQILPRARPGCQVFLQDTL